jgi:hypothetical protein
VLATYQVGEDPDVLAFDPTLKLLYVSAESGHVAVFRERGKALVSEGESFMPHAHTFCVDPGTRLVYFPLQDIDGHPIFADHGTCCYQSDGPLQDLLERPFWSRHADPSDH